MTSDRSRAMLVLLSRRMWVIPMASDATLTKRSARTGAFPHPAEHHRYQELKAKVENAAERLDRAVRRPRPSEIRRAYAELGYAIGRAVKFVEGRVRLPYRGLGPSPAVPVDPFTAAVWHRELEELRDARERVRFAALDDPYYGIPTVRVATRAATSPDLPGLRTGDHDATSVPGHGLGIALDGVVGVGSLRGTAVDGYPSGRGNGELGQSRTLAPRTAA
jgi:hypothetical protein